MLQALSVESSEIVVTASLAPQAQDETPASATILDSERIERLGKPLLPDFLRLTPSVAVAASGPAGSLTEVRIRGAEANHTLLFVDGIRANDPAAGNVPRFELLNSDLFNRVEIVRGPQSALWGSEAIGGVVAVGSAARRDGNQLAALGEIGSFGFRRAAARAAGSTNDLDISLAAGWQRAAGIDSFDGNGDLDGYRNLSGRFNATWTPSSTAALGVSGFALSGRSEFDGYSPVTFLRADTLDSSRNRLAAGRVWTRIGREGGAVTGRVAGSLLRSSNRNLLATDEINQTWGKRATISGNLEHRFTTGPVRHLLVAAAEHEREDFKARDIIYGGFSNQDRDRNHQAVTAEWRADAGPLHSDVAVRRDIFSRFKDATTLRASLLGELGQGLSLTGSYAEGIAQPTFFDLYGFFPGTFTGNPDLKPERSRGFELAARYRAGALRASLGWYRQRLVDEIVDSPDFTSTVTSEGTSRRSGLEAEVDWLAGPWLRLSSHYALLTASEGHGSTDPTRELRRPKHSGSLTADGVLGRVTYGASLAYSGARIDRRDGPPYDRLRIGAHWRSDLRLAYAVTETAEVFARAANALDERQQDVFGYRTEGRSVHVGIRLAHRR